MGENVETPFHTTVEKVGDMILLTTPRGDTINFGTLAIARQIAQGILDLVDGPDTLDALDHEGELK